MFSAAPPRAARSGAALLFGVNLAGADFGPVAPSEGSPNTIYPGTNGTEYAYPNARELDYYKSRGRRVIRLPFRWERMQPRRGGPLDAAQLRALDAVVNAAAQRSMLVLLDCHNYGRYNALSADGKMVVERILGDPELPFSTFADFWKQMARHYSKGKKSNAILGYGLMNEPHDMRGASDWPRAAQAAVDAIRAVDKTTAIFVAGDNVIILNLRRAVRATVMAAGVFGLVLFGEWGMGRPPLGNAAPPETRRTLNVESFGAKGNGLTDDTASVQRALDSLRTGDRLMFPAGKVYRHSDVLTVNVAGVRLSGPGTLLATNEARSNFRINANNVLADNGLTFKMASTTRRWDAYEQMKLRLSGHTGIVLRNIIVDGSAAAGIYIGNGCSRYLLEDVTVQNTRADGIHNTDAAHDGTIRRPVIRNVGDDGVAVVSYSKPEGVAPCRNITIESPRFYGNVWGRAFSVVGGEDITFRNVYAENSNAAAVYVACEGEPYYTFASKRIRVLGGTLKNSNASTTVDHGAVLVYSGRAGYSNDDIEISDMKIINTRPTASRQVGVLGEANRVQLRNFSFSGGPRNLFSTNVPADRYNTTGWMLHVPVADHTGYRLPTPTP